jgi:hypothetical protein
MVQPGKCYDFKVFITGQGQVLLKACQVLVLRIHENCLEKQEAEKEAFHIKRLNKETGNHRLLWKYL